MSTTPDPAMPVVAFVWHQHLGEGSKSLRWTQPTQWDYAQSVDALVRQRDGQAALAALQARLDEAEKQAGECDGGYQTLERELAAVKDALLLVVQQHDAWAAQMPDGRFSDPLAEAIDAARAQLAASKKEQTHG